MAGTDSRQTAGGHSDPVTPFTTSGLPATRPSASDPTQGGVVVINPDGSAVAGGSGGTSMLDDAPFTPGGSSVTPAGFLADDVATDPVDEGDIGAARMNPTTRVQYVQLKDAAGADVAVGGGTQYTEDVAAAADPIGTALNLIRADSLAAVTTTDGDNVAARGTNKGEQYVKHVDSVAITAAALPLPSGATTEATLAANTGALTEVAPATDTASSGLNGRLQRIAQRLTSLIALLPSALVGGRLDTNLGGIAGTATDVNSGNKGNGTLRVVLATDQPALTNKILVTPDSVALPANQSTNVAQINGVTPLMGAGNTGTGSPRVTIATDQANVPVAEQAVTSGGESNYSALSTAAVLTAQIKGSAGQVYDVQIFNTGAAAVFARLYDQTGAPASTDGANIVWRGIVPGNTAGAGFVVTFPKGRVFTTGVGIRVSGAIADNDATVLTANAVVANVGYK